jgi:hypothetical protein
MGGEMTDLKKTCTLLFGGVYVVVWGIAAYAYFFRHHFDAEFLLGIYTLPSSLLVSAVSLAFLKSLHISQDTKTVVDFVGFLIFGGLQYLIIGYLFGAIVGTFVKLFRR